MHACIAPRHRAGGGRHTCRACSRSESHVVIDRVTMPFVTFSPVMASVMMNMSAASITRSSSTVALPGRPSAFATCAHRAAPG